MSLESETKKEAIHELLQKASVFCQVRDLEGLEQAILSREKVMSTGFGRGVAISHGETPGLNGIIIGLGLSVKGIDFESIDGGSVHLLFLIANSLRNREEYLEVLSTLSRTMRSQEFRETLLACSTEEEVARLLGKMNS